MEKSYNNASINYINDKSKDMILKDTQEDNKLFTKNMLTLVCCCQHTANHRLFKNCGITDIYKNVKAGINPPKRNSRIR